MSILTLTKRLAETPQKYFLGSFLYPTVEPLKKSLLSCPRDIHRVRHILKSCMRKHKRLAGELRLPLCQPAAQSHSEHWLERELSEKQAHMFNRETTEPSTKLLPIP